MTQFNTKGMLIQRVQILITNSSHISATVCHHCQNFFLLIIIHVRLSRHRYLNIPGIKRTMLNITACMLALDSNKSQELCVFAADLDLTSKLSWD